MKRRFINVSVVLMMVTGLCILAVLIGKPLLSIYNAHQATSDDILNSVSAEQINENRDRLQHQPGDVNLDGEILGTGHDAALIENVDFIPADASLNTDLMIGEIYIPELDLRQPILDEMTNENLWVSATTMKPGQVMGEGNFALAGHMMADKELLFSPLENAETGQAVYLTDKTDIYEYEISDINVVHESQGQVISDDVGEQMITLVTCEHPWDPDTRIIVQGELKDQYHITEANDDVQSTFLGTLEDAA